MTFQRVVHLGVAVLFAFAAFTTGAYANDTTFSGQATVVNASVGGLGPVVLSDTGPLPSSGGAQEASILNATVPGLLTAEVLHASTVAGGNQSEAEASVADLNLTVAGNSVAATLFFSQATAVCNNGQASTSGGSEIAGLVVNGQAIVVSGQPNQQISLPLGGQVTINEQSSSPGSITVNALHIFVPGVANVIISSAHADISCAAPPFCNHDFVTGGGFIFGTPSGARANFGVAGGIKNGGLWGHLNYIDHGTGRHVRGTGVTAYVVVDAVTRHIEGTCDIDGQLGTYQVDVADNGEPGRNDTFAIRLSNGYQASGNLAGGNIKLHTCF
jgi:hypothetical protein